MFGQFFSLFNTPLFRTFGHAAKISAPIWLPLLIFVIAFDLWMNYKRREYIREKGSTFLEIKLPREMTKSPIAMELFLNSIHEPVPSSHIFDTYLNGSVRPWHSLELVSINGTIHFYIWSRKAYQSVIEAQLYAQFPGIEVHEAPDYALAFEYDPDKIDVGWFGYMVKVKDSIFPIKTYVDYGLDQDPKEEYKIDPLVSLLEFMGSFKEGEQAWIQIMIQAHTVEKRDHGRFFTKPDWKWEFNKKLQEFITKNAPTTEGTNKTPTVRDLTKDLQEGVYAMERNQGKWAYDTMIRMGHFAPKDQVRSQNTGGIIRSFKGFTTGMNGLKPGWYTGFKYSNFQDYKNIRKIRNNRKMFEAYKRRSFFNPPFKNFHGEAYVLSVEELATLFHFPSVVVAATPTLSRIPSKKAEAPANLPI